MQEKTEQIIRIIAVMSMIFSAGIIFSFILNERYYANAVSYVEYTFKDVEGNKDVNFNKEVLKLLEMAYNSYDVEYKFCLDGFKKKGKYYITDIYEVNVLFTNATKLIGRGCGSKAIGDIHNHIRGSCKMSDTDIKTYESNVNEFNNKELLSMVQCGPKKFGIYQYQNYTDSLEWGIIDD